MALLDRVKERTGSDLSDSELSAMIDAIAADMDARFGPAGPITIEHGDLAVREEGAGGLGAARLLPTAIFARWSNPE